MDRNKFLKILGVTAVVPSLAFSKTIKELIFSKINKIPLTTSIYLDNSDCTACEQCLSTEYTELIENKAHWKENMPTGTKDPNDPNILYGVPWEDASELFECPADCITEYMGTE